MLNYLKTNLGRLRRDKRGITGLETAIILIAFVVVASVFAYTVLSAGIFSSERGKEAIHAGLQEARSSLEPRGSALAYDDEDVYDNAGTAVVAAAGEAVTKVSFVVSTALQGEEVDLTPPYQLNGTNGNLETTGLDYVLVISYADENQYISDMAWTIEFVGKASGDYLLETGEKAEISIWLLDLVWDTDHLEYRLGTDTGDPFMDAAATLLGTNQQFNAEVKAPHGAVINLQRTTPPRLDPVMNLY